MPVTTEVADASAQVAAYDAELIARVGRGDRGGALAELYGRYARRLHGLGLHTLNDPGLAEELVQETFVRVWRGAARFDPAQGTVRAWIFTIARHAAIDLHRKRARHKTGLAPELDDTADDARPYEDLVESLTVRDALDSLPDAHREVLELAYHQGLTQTEVAARLAVPLGTVKSRTFTALGAMRTALTERGIDG